MIKIAAAEVHVMEALWRKSPLSFDDIVAEVGPANGWAATTVRTLVTRLLSKKAIAGAKGKAGYVYKPLVARAAYVRAESKGLLDRLFDGEVAPLVAHMAEHRALTARDLKKLEALIAKLKARDNE